MGIIRSPRLQAWENVTFLFPLYLGIALLADKNKNLNRLLILFSLSLLIFSTVLFVNGYFLND
jgi:hypothetical protein